MTSITLIGGGNMGEALVAGLIRSGHWKPSQITVTDVRPDVLKRLRKAYGICICSDNRLAIHHADIVLLAVKPQQMSGVLKDLGPSIRRSQRVLSIAAGIRTDFLERFLVPGVSAIRIMPNTPALVGAGAAAIAPGRWAKAADLKMARAIFGTVGTVVQVKERDMDAVTALSGSGPAYVFFLAETLLEAGVALGLAPSVADALVRQTLRGAGQLLSQSPDEPRVLRQKVTSPGGTTEAALQVLSGKGFKKIFAQALRRAAQRSHELSKTSD
ncbi:MAG: pyrroline-5-carboxylate reductase [Elusimicrobiota bacterium]|jgi:pyrroline-5-carboxylate reductase